MKKTTGIQEQLVVLRGMTAQTGVLHEAQLFQLRLWPHALFDKISNAEIRIDQEKYTIEYVFTWKIKGKKTADFKRRAKYLGKSIHWLLGDHWQVTVDGFAMNRKSEPPTDTWRGTDYAAGMVVPKTPWKFPQTQSKK